MTTGISHDCQQTPYSQGSLTSQQSPVIYMYSQGSLDTSTMLGDAGLMTTRSPLVIDDANSSNSIHIKQMKYSRLIH